ncbi:MAG TPA: hypothetical protein VK741_22905 [Acetobacteraceae bacterium]|jgi:hypothetical protein|nr:hypothetical protein [Acetobacteraceae bacterium]
MRYRRLDANGDMTFGHGQSNFWIDQPEGVAQSVMTRLRLNLGEYFADQTDGTPWNTQVLGERTAATRDIVVVDRVQTTPNVTTISAYNSVVDPNTRTWSAAMTINTAYGVAVLQAAKLPGAVPPLGVSLGGRSMLLGIQGSLRTPLEMQPADLSQSVAHISDFRITALDAGTF